MGTENGAEVLVPVGAAAREVDVQRRMREVMDDLGFRSMSAAAREAGFDPAHLCKLLHKDRPHASNLERLAQGWGLRSAVFLLTREEARPLVEGARRAREERSA